MTPRHISFITSSLDQSTHIELTVNSVLSQQYPKRELIVIWCGSRVQSVAVIKKKPSLS